MEEFFTSRLPGFAMKECPTSLLYAVAGTLFGILLSLWAPRVVSIVHEKLWKGTGHDDRVGGSSVPKHIAVIMDGNRRFGKRKHGDPLKGHWAGGQTLLDFIQWCMNDGVEIVTVYAFSTENWSRDTAEINLLMTMFGKYAETMAEEAKKRNVKVKILSTDYNRLPYRVMRSVENLEEATKDCDGLLLNVCLSYGARAEISAACSSLVEDVLCGKLDVEGVDVNQIDSGSSNSSSNSSSSSVQVDLCDSSKLEGGVEESKGEQREMKHKSVASSASLSEEVKDNSEGKIRMSVTTEKKKVKITEEMVGERLLSKGLPDPDLLIRTSGEVRISNFLLYQLAYTEMFFVEKFWPEFSRDDFVGVLKQFADRKRRFGA